MRLKNPVTWIATALMLAFASPALADDTPDNKPRVERNDKRIREAKTRTHKNKKTRKNKRDKPRKLDPTMFSKRVHTRLGKIAARVDKAVVKKKLPPEVLAKMRRTLTTRSAVVEAALDKAVADGALTKLERRSVREEMKLLRKTLREHRGKDAKKANKRKKRNAESRKRSNRRRKAKPDPKPQVKARAVPPKALRNPFAGR